MKKKLLALICVLAMVLSIAACGSDSDSDSSSKKKKSDKKETTVSTEISDTTESTDKTETSTASDDSPASVSVTVEDTTSKEYAPGVNAGNTYYNDYFGIACSLDSNWTLKSTEEILQINQTAAGMVSSDYADLFSATNVVTDMYAVNVNGTDTINVTIEMISAANSGVTEQEIVNSSESLLADALTSMGIENVVTSQTTFSLGSSVHPAIIVEGSYSGIAIHEFVAVIKSGNYILNLSACSWYSNRLDEYAALFTAY